MVILQIKIVKVIIVLKCEVTTDSEFRFFSGESARKSAVTILKIILKII